MQNKIKLLMLAVTLVVAAGCNYRQDVRLLYWNIQNGMWADQQNNYDNFVAWVKAQEPQICVFAEAQSIFVSESDKRLPKEERYLVNGWDELAARYGHKYVYVGMHRDSYPQVITSVYPIENVERIEGAIPDTVVCHGAGWAKIAFGKKALNIVTVHTWPHIYGYGIDRKNPDVVSASKAACEGDYYRVKEMEYICGHTVLGSKDKYWMMLGDFNSKSSRDNFQYKYPADSCCFLLHDYILNRTPYMDVVSEKHPGEFIPSMWHRYTRLDYIYMTPALYRRVKSADIIWDEYTTPVRTQISNFSIPSDHVPIIVDMKL